VQPGFVQIVQDFPTRLQRHPQAGKVILRTMFETDRLPVDWAEACNRADQIWVPSEFNRMTFADAGVAQEKLEVIPGCLAPVEFEVPVEATALVKNLREGCEFLFLSVFDWTRHKGWDVLLKGFLETFAPESGVRLVLKVWSTNGYNYEQIVEQAARYVQEAMGIDLAADPRVRFVFERLSRPELLALYQGCDAFVLPSRGEGWGRPFMEAMACGKPTLGTNWSGNTAFMNAENSYLIDCEVVPVPEIGWRELPTYRGHRWAEPNLQSLCAQMRAVVEHRAEAAKKGKAAREYVLAHFSRAKVGKLMAAELGQCEASRKDAKMQRREDAEGSRGDAETRSKEAEERGSHKGTKARRGEKFSVSELSVKSVQSVEKALSPVALRWEGAFFVWHSLGLVNREIGRRLMGLGAELSLVPTEPDQFDAGRFPELRGMAERVFAPLARTADVQVRHCFPPRFDRPEGARHLALIQPWEYGFLPKAWIEPILSNVSEVWCYSEYVRQVYLASGIPEERLQVVPLGVDAEVFRPEAPPFIFTKEAGAFLLPKGMDGRFVFLFVGGTLHRKGIDILLEAYQRAFSAYDDVCLVIKDTCTQTVYQGQNEQEKILALAGDPSRPAVIYLEEDLPAWQLAGLYTASHCVVLPYRGEGFCLPALEALACGVPVIVSHGGPTDDFVDETVGWRVAAEKKPFGNGKIGHWECVGPTWQFEVSPQDLGRQMRQVFQQREEAKKRGEAGRKRVVEEGWTWDDTARRVLERSEALREMPPITEARARHAKSAKEEVGEQAQQGITSPVSAPVREKAGRSDSSPVSDRRASAKAAPAKRRVPTISLCMIVKNEERVLDACLTSVKAHVDEIVLVDTGSTDRTVEIAKSHGVKLYHFPWCDDFSAARNISLSHATGDWVIWMDADDTLPEECGNKFRELILLAETEVTGFIMQVHIPPPPGGDGFTIVDHVKIFRNKPEHRFEGRIHEQILEPLYRAGGRIEKTNLFVIHSGYDYSPEGQKHKRERDLRILALDVAERPNHPFPRFNIGMTHHHLKNFDLAIEALEQSLALSKPHESTVRKIYAMLGSCHLEKGEAQKAKERIEEGLALTPRDPELLFRAGAVYRTIGDLAAAEKSYLLLLSEPETGHIDSLDVSLTGYKARHNLALLYQDMQRWNDAEAQWKAAVAEAPRFLPSWLGLAELYLRLRRLEEVRGIAAEIEAWAPQEAADLRRRV
jgi:glycosyltransferase involved in cell wall biosynthesis